MAVDEMNEITEYINKYNFKDIVIALMNIENNDGGKLNQVKYNQFSKSYDYYINNRNVLTKNLKINFKNQQKSFTFMLQNDKMQAGK